MRIESPFLLEFSTGSNNHIRKNMPGIKPWVRMAITEEEQKPAVQLWAKEPSAAFRYNERLKRIRFFRKHGKAYPRITLIADQLERCEANDRCCSSACPECGRLLQRWFVRKTKTLIRDTIDHPDQRLVAISIIPADPIITPCNLHTLEMGNLQRRLKYALNRANITIAIGGIDFSYNEDREGRYEPFWCPHLYIVASIKDRKRVKRLLKELYKKDGRRIPRPVKMSAFDNCAYRRSYVFKIDFKRRIGIKKKRNDGTTRQCRDTSRDKLRAIERLELFAYLDKIGFASRFVFRSVKPDFRGKSVVIRKIPKKGRRIRQR